MTDNDITAESGMPTRGGEYVVPIRQAPVKWSSRGNAWPILSIVVPAYSEEGNLDRLYEELAEILDSVGITWELIIVDDGSNDGTWQKISALFERDPRVKGLRFSRNFGHQYSIFAGLSHAQGNAVITMDADLQHPPSVIPRLLEEWRKGNMIVHTVRGEQEYISPLKRMTSKAFYKIFSYLSGVELSSGMADFRLLDRKVVAEIVRLREGGLFLRGLVHWLGYPSAKVEFQSGHRFSGHSKYTIRKMFTLAWAGITSFSIIPLRIAIVIGIVTSIFAFYQLGEALYVRLFTDQALPGWASIYGTVSLLFGVLFVLIGILGEYIARILEEVRRRPRYIISDVIGFDAGNLISPQRSESEQFTLSASSDEHEGYFGSDRSDHNR